MNRALWLLDDDEELSPLGAWLLVCLLIVAVLVAARLETVDRAERRAATTAEVVR